MTKPWALAAALFAAAGAVAALVLLRGGEFHPHAAVRLWTHLRIEVPEAAAAAEAEAVAEAQGPEPEWRARHERRRRVERTLLIGKPTTASDLAAAAGWMRSLAVHASLPRLLGPEAERARLEKTLAEATNPVARQNAIFLAVLTLPADVSHPWLAGLMRGGPGGDAEDALVALAFDGDATARAEFARLAGAPSRAPVRRLLDHWVDHEELGQTGTEEARDILRSYRAIEVLDRLPYFKFTFEITRHVPWVPHPTRKPIDIVDMEFEDEASLDLDRDLLGSWIARYPGHPGSDDMAVRLGRGATRRGAHFEAARWYSRAATMPDQDLCECAVDALVATCELKLEPDDLDRLAHEQGLLTPNRGLVQYIRLRRLAVERGFDVGVWHAAALGRDEPHSVLGYAWNHRNGAPVPKGLLSGLAQLPPEDPLRTVADVPPYARPEGAPPPASLPACLEETSRLDPWPERLQIDEAALMRQFRAWDAIAALELRAARATGDERADLLYKVAAVLYHDPHAVFPAYGDVFDFRTVFRTVTRVDRESFSGFVRTSYPLVRAIRVFERIEREHGTYAGIDKVLFSKGLAWAKLLRYRCEAHELAEGVRSDDRDEARRLNDGMKIREAVGALERCVAISPTSPLADDALRAALYWRRARPDVFR